MTFIGCRLIGNHVYTHCSPDGSTHSEMHPLTDILGPNLEYVLHPYLVELNLLNHV